MNNLERAREWTLKWYRDDSQDGTEKFVHPLADLLDAVAKEAPGLKGRLAARLDEYKFIEQMIPSVEKEGWFKRRIAHLQEMYDNAGPQEASS